MNAKQEDGWGSFIWGAIAIVGFILVAAAILFPMFARTGRCGGARKSTCQTNLKELGIAVQLYAGDYNGVLPSSFLYGGSKTWNSSDFVHFAKERGVLPPVSNATAQTWPMLLYPQMKTRDIIWCPSDPNRKEDPSATVSYYWKAAVDRAWYGDDNFKAQKESDYAFSADQIIMYEHSGWHWGDVTKGLVDGVVHNCVFMDGHVQAKKIMNSGYTSAENPPEPLPRSGVGEPAWFNCNLKKNPKADKTEKAAHWDPREWADILP